MRVFWAFAAFMLSCVVVPSASAQSITTRDPRLYMETLANAMGVSGIAPLRSIYGNLANDGPISNN